MSAFRNLHIDLSDDFASATSPEGSFTVLVKQAKERFGYTRFHYRQGYTGNQDGLIDQQVARSLMGDDYLRAYLPLKASMDDPLVKHCILSPRPKLWSELENDAHRQDLSPRMRAKARFIRDFGLQAGVSTRLSRFPSGPGCFVTGISLIQDLGTSPIEHDQHFAWKSDEIMTMLAHFSASAPPGAFARQILELSTREYDILALVADGLQVQQIADRFGLADRTVAHHLSSLRGKLGAGTNAQAVAFAIRMQLI